MSLQNVRTMSKGDKPPYLDARQFSYTSDVSVFYLHDQEWQTLVDEGLSYLFNDSQAELEARKRAEEAGQRNEKL